MIISDQTTTKFQNLCIIRISFKKGAVSMQNVVQQTDLNMSKQPSIRPRGKNLRWIIVCVITLLSIANYLDRGNLSVAAPLIMKDLHLNAAAMGVILSSFVWPYAVMNLPSGWAVDRFGAKVIMTA